MKNESKQKVSVVVPVYNELKNIEKLLIRLSDTLTEAGYLFELIFVDDHSTDGTFEYLQRFTSGEKVVLHRKKGRRGKAYSLVEGFSLATGSVLVMIDADLQYPIEAIPSMLQQLAKHDVVVSNRKRYQDSFARKIFSKTFRFWFGKFLFGLNHDIQSGLKVFKKEVFDTVSFTPKSGWTFDLEFLHRAKEAGYSIRNYDIIFHPRKNGTSNISFVKTTWEIGINALRVRLQTIPPMTIKPTQKNSMIGAGVAHKKKKYITHSLLPHYHSALYTLNTSQKALFASIFLILCAGLIINPIAIGLIMTAFLSFIYFVDVLFNLYLVLKSLYLPQEIKVEEKELTNLNDTVLPVYTILCPLYKEAHVIPQFLSSLRKLDWPENKLDVILLIEEDDVDSITALKHTVLPNYVRVAVVPDSVPKTKPKACNYGLSIAQGEYLVIYDAEDVPDPLQLKKAYITFQKVPSNVRCLQAKLNYYNPHQNLLTRFFTAEYSLWFDVTLTGLQTLGTSIPLGGTSNHFKTQDLRKLYGWDPFNVTEDADLGIRLFKRGYKTAIIDSTTLEEANSNFRNWIRQRSRWLKGYMQTYLVHGRQNFSFARQHGIHALIFQLIIGGKIAFILINPFLWVATISYFVLYAIVGPTIEALYPRYIFYMAVVSLVFGNFLFLYYYMIGAMKRGHYTLVKYVYLVPLYWLMISTAGFVAFFQLLFKPHYWEKTVHGFHLQKDPKKVVAKMVIGTEEQATNTPVESKTRIQIRRFFSLPKHIFAGGSLVAASIIGNFLNLFFNAYLGKELPFQDFALISLVGSFLYVSYIPLNALTATANYRTGVLDGKHGKEIAYFFWSTIRRKALVPALLVFIGWIALTPILDDYFKTKSMEPFILFAPIWLIGFAASIDKGFMFGRLMFVSLALMTVIEPVTKLLSAVFFVQTGLHAYVYTAIPISILVSFFFGWAVILLMKKGHLKKTVEPYEIHFPKKFFAVSALAGLSTMSFLSLDIIMAKHFLAPTEAGQYALLSLVGKMVFFLGMLSQQFLMSFVSQNEGKNVSSKKTLYYIAFFTYLLTFFGFLAFGVFGSYTLPLIFGAKANVILPYLVYFTFAMMCFTISRVFVSYYLTKKVYTFPIVAFFLSILQVVLISINHANIASIVLSMVITGGLSLVMMILLHLNLNGVKVVERNLLDLITLFTGNDEKEQNARNGKLRILIFNWRDIKHRWAGGAEVYIHEIAKRWASDGNSVTLFSGNDGHSPRNQVLDGITIVRRGGLFTVYIWAFLYYILKFRRSYDVIIDCENGIPFFTPLYSKTPVVLLIHHIHQDVFRRYLRFPLSYFARYLEAGIMPFIYKMQTVVTISDSSKKEILKYLPKSLNNIQIVHPGINNADYVQREKADYPMFTYLGRLKPYKNVDVAIKAFAHIMKEFPRARLHIAGEGESEKMLLKLVESLQVTGNVIFHGKVTEKEKRDLFAKSWAVLQPSMIEGWGITVIEANASGSPVIASNVPGLKDSIVHKETGVLVDVGNVDAFAQAMKHLITDEKIRKLYTRNASEWSESFSWDKSADTFYSAITRYLTVRTGYEIVGNIALAKK